MTVPASSASGNPQSPQSPLVRFVYSQPLWRRRLVVLAVLAVAFALPALYGWRVVTAQRVTIHVTDCPDQPAKFEGCGATWTLPDGTRGHGVIDGYAPSRGDGVTVAGWATAGRATTDLSIWYYPPINGLVVIIGAVCVIWFFAWRLRRRRRG